MALLVIFALGLIFFFIWAIRKFAEGSKNAKMIADDNQFKQGDVTVLFKSGKIIIKTHSYDVNQVTGITAQVYRATGRSTGGNAWESVIEVDDLNHPRHKMIFLSESRAKEFTQRLCVALRKAGGPSFS